MPHVVKTEVAPWFQANCLHCKFEVNGTRALSAATDHTRSTGHITNVNVATLYRLTRHAQPRQED